jgi:hypothetical protein
MNESKDEGGFDLIGFGKIANAIPQKVYERAAGTLLKTFEDLTAPITETTGGLGRYLRQKFDNMVDAEKAIATYVVELAIARASRRMESKGGVIVPPQSSKTFVRSIEEASQETEPLLHEMWVNLIASQLANGISHPHFVEILAHFSPAEARLLIELVPMEGVGEHGGGYISMGDFGFEYWLPRADAEPRPWSISCLLLFDFAFINGLAMKDPKNTNTTILYRNQLGSAFLEAVSPSAYD